MTAQELIRELPKGVLMWYPFQQGKRVTVINEENIGSIESVDPCDYLIVTAAWEEDTNPARLFSGLRDRLNVGGKMLVLMNNRLGLRYFCGDKDRYSKTVLDCLEDYRNADMKDAGGRMYDKAQMKDILRMAGFAHFQFFSVFSDLENPSLIFAEDYIPNEDLTNRIIPSYNNPETIYIEEKTLYQQLVDNGLFHQLANAYLAECSLDGRLSDVSHVTSSLERGREDALFTIIHRSGIVEKRAAYVEGVKRLEEIDRNMRQLKENGIGVVEGRLERKSDTDVSYQMEFIRKETVQLYFKRLLRTDIEAFLREMDCFRDIILSSSEIISPDTGDGRGAVLRQGFMDLVPLNSFYIDGSFVFYDQEFCMDELPANVLIWRMVASFYAADLGAEKIYPKDRLLERYHLKERLSEWKTAEWDFLKALRKETLLEEYHRKRHADRETILNNRKRMNASARYLEQKHEDIFAGIEGRQLILFGTGKYAQKFLALYGEDFPVYAMLDNNAEKTGQKLCGIPIKAPSYLLELPKDSFKVIICIRNYADVEMQLEELGIDAYSIYHPDKYYQTRPRTSLRVLEDACAAGKKKYHIGYVAGAFDMFHIGHLRLLQRAKEQCDYLIVGVMSDEKMFRLKHKYPVIPCSERVEVVAGCRYVNQVEELALDRAGIRDAYHLFHFDCMFSGDDHSGNKGWLEDREYLRSQGADIVFLPYTKETSSTEIRNRMQD